MAREVNGRMMYRCLLCCGEFQFGPHRYAGKPVNYWKAMACQGCLAANHDGIVPETYPHLLPYLEKIGARPTYNEKGWLEWPHPISNQLDGLQQTLVRKK
ncbi:MAG: hypothetical protein WDN25_13335 [Acetobacteraceae bacterium]